MMNEFAAPRCREEQEAPPSLGKPGKPHGVQLWKTDMCVFFPQCRKGAECPFAHTQEELHARPNLSKTRICKAWRQGQCLLSSSECKFAHGSQDLMNLPKANLGGRVASPGGRRTRHRRTRRGPLGGNEDGDSAEGMLRLTPSASFAPGCISRQVSGEGGGSSTRTPSPMPGAGDVTSPWSRQTSTEELSDVTSPWSRQSSTEDGEETVRSDSGKATTSSLQGEIRTSRPADLTRSGQLLQVGQAQACAPAVVFLAIKATASQHEAVFAMMTQLITLSQTIKETKAEIAEILRQAMPTHYED